MLIKIAHRLYLLVELFTELLAPIDPDLASLLESRACRVMIWLME